MVGMGELKVVRLNESDSCSMPILMALGLGSCIGLCAYDGQARVAGMAHVVLPESTTDGDHPPGKFADTAVPALVESLTQLGGSLNHIEIALAGGAQLFSFNGGGTRLEIGNRNADSVQKALKKHGLKVAAQDLGGSVGRTVQFFSNGLVRVKSIGQGERNLVQLGKYEKRSR